MTVIELHNFIIINLFMAKCHRFWLLFLLFTDLFALFCGSAFFTCGYAKPISRLLV